MKLRNLSSAGGSDSFLTQEDSGRAVLAGDLSCPRESQVNILPDFAVS